jgi:hypothetical protein
MRRDFALPEQDNDFLEASGYNWDTLRDGHNNWVIIHNYPVPEGYNVTTVSVALKIDQGYPVSQIDMAYFFPKLSLRNGKVISASQANQIIIDNHFQRWSRHRTGQNPWRPGLDDISTQLNLVNFWLERELTK